jgi:hypothetical protein
MPTLTRCPPSTRPDRSACARGDTWNVGWLHAWRRDGDGWRGHRSGLAAEGGFDDGLKPGCRFTSIGEDHDGTVV